MIGSHQDQRLARIFAVECIGETDGAIELAIVVNYRRDVREMACGIDIFRLDKSEEAAWIMIVQQANRRPRHIVNRRLDALVAVELEAHIAGCEEAENLAW